MGQGGPNPQEFITKATQELQESRVMRGSHLLPDEAPHPGEDGGLRVCIDYPGLNRVMSQGRFSPSRVGRCKGPPHSYVCMPFGLPNVAAAHQHLMRSIVEAQEVSHHAFLKEMGMDLEEPPGPTEPPEAQGSKRLVRAGFFTAHRQLIQHPLCNYIR